MREAIWLEEISARVSSELKGQVSSRGCESGQGHINSPQSGAEMGWGEGMDGGITYAMWAANLVRMLKHSFWTRLEGHPALRSVLHFGKPFSSA